MFKTAAEVNAEKLASARTAAIERIEAGYQQELSIIHKRFPNMEREGWHELIKDAENGVGECIDEYSASLDISIEKACERVINANSAYRKLYGKATGKLTLLRDKVDVAKNIDDLVRINWD